MEIFITSKKKNILKAQISSKPVCFFVDLWTAVRECGSHIGVQDTPIIFPWSQRRKNATFCHCGRPSIADEILIGRCQSQIGNSSRQGSSIQVIILCLEFSSMQALWYNSMDARKEIYSPRWDGYYFEYIYYVRFFSKKRKIITKNVETYLIMVNVNFSQG